LGIRLLRPSGQGSAFGFGLIRLLLGVGFGLAIFIAGGMMHLEVPRHPLLMYFEVYVPVRLIEWSIIFYLIREQSRAFSAAKSSVWIIGGIVVSHVADIPMFLLMESSPRDMLPVGRFLC
jgi:hypothetical protein